MKLIQNSSEIFFHDIVVAWAN